MVMTLTTFGNGHNAGPDVDVVVAGGGPVGLMLACELRLGGASVLVLERLTEIDQTVKAGSLTVPAVEALYRRGMLPQVLEEQQRMREWFQAFARPRQAAPPQPPQSLRAAPLRRPLRRTVPRRRPHRRHRSRLRRPGPGRLRSHDHPASRGDPSRPPRRRTRRRGPPRGRAHRFRGGRRRRDGDGGRRPHPGELAGRLRRRPEPGPPAGRVRLPRHRPRDHRAPGRGPDDRQRGASARLEPDRRAACTCSARRPGGS